MASCKKRAESYLSSLRFLTNGRVGCTNKRTALRVVPSTGIAEDLNPTGPLSSRSGAEASCFCSTARRHHSHGGAYRVRSPSRG